MGRAELILFAAVVSGGFSVVMLVRALFGNQSKDARLLAWASDNERPKSKSPVIALSLPLVHQFTLKYALRIKNKTFRKSVEHNLMISGMSRELSVDEFLGLKLLWGVVFPIFLMLMNFAADGDLPTAMFLLIIPLGFMAPDIHARGAKAARVRSVQIDLPFFIDLLALSTEAGLDFIPAIQRIVDKAQNSVLAEELSIVLKDIRIGQQRIQAIRGMAHRLDMPEITSFVAVMADADKTGAPISRVLKDQSEQLRLDRFVRAEKAGARASQSMLIPLMFLILPAVFVVVFGPVAVQFLTGGDIGGGN